MKIIIFKKEKMKLLTKEQQKSYENRKTCHSCLKEIGNKCLKDKQYHKDRDHCHYTGKYGGVAHRICNLK